MPSPSTSIPFHRAAVALSLALSGFAAAAATAATAATPAAAPTAGGGAVTPEIQSRYEQERSRCLAGQSGQSQETCLKEAGAARDAARQGQLNDGGAKYRKNAKDRCDALGGDERRDCMARMKGAANSSESGSVKGGGIIRETVTREPAAVPLPVPTPASAASAN